MPDEKKITYWWVSSVQSRKLTQTKFINFGPKTPSLKDIVECKCCTSLPLCHTFSCIFKCDLYIASTIIRSTGKNQEHLWLQLNFTLHEQLRNLCSEFFLEPAFWFEKQLQTVSWKNIKLEKGNVLAPVVVNLNATVLLHGCWHLGVKIIKCDCSISRGAFEGQPALVIEADYSRFPINSDRYTEKVETSEICVMGRGLLQFV